MASISCICTIQKPISQQCITKLNLNTGITDRPKEIIHTDSTGSTTYLQNEEERDHNLTTTEKQVAAISWGKRRRMRGSAGEALADVVPPLAVGLCLLDPRGDSGMMGPMAPRRQGQAFLTLCLVRLRHRLTARAPRCPDGCPGSHRRW